MKRIGVRHAGWVRAVVAAALAVALLGCAKGQDPEITPVTSGGPDTTSQALLPCPAGGPDATTSPAGCIGPDGAVERP